MKKHSTIAFLLRFSGKTGYILLLLALLSSAAVAQVGFNNPTPDPSSLLDLKANDRGLLIPRMTGNQRNSIVNPAEGLLVFDTDLKMFMFYTSGKWMTLNPWLATDASQGADIKTGDVTIPGTQKVGIGKTPATALDVNGTASATNLQATGTVTAPTVTATTVNATNGNGIIPIGGIIMWSGNTIPDGWALCDGNTFLNGVRVPDLQGRFVVGVGSGPGLSTYTLKETGGEESHTLSVAEMPAHGHTGTTSTNGDHRHGVPADDGGGGGYGYKDKQLKAEGDCNGCIADFYGYTDASGNHSHTLTTNNAGGGQAHENRPPYFALAYIIRIR